MISKVIKKFIPPILRPLLLPICRLFLYPMRVLRNPVINNKKSALMFAILPPSWYTKSSSRRKRFGISEFTQNGITTLNIPGVGYFGVASHYVNGGLVKWLVDITILDEYEAISVINRGDTVIDIGANGGAFTLLASKLVGSEGLVLAIEPEPLNYNALCSTLRENSLWNVRPLQLAIGNYTGELNLFIYNDNPGAHSAVIRRGQVHSKVIKVPITSIDKICEEQSLSRLDFLKIDVEGYEPEVLEGARESIARFRPVISMAAYHFPKHPTLLPKLIHQIAPNYHIRVAAAAPGLELKCLAVPIEKLP